MLQVNLADAEKNLESLIKTLENYKQDKIVLTLNGKPIAEIKRPKNEIALKRLPGLGKDKFTFDNKLFDDLDEEIGKMFLKGTAQ